MQDPLLGPGPRRGDPTDELSIAMDRFTAASLERPTAQPLDRPASVSFDRQEQICVGTPAMAESLEPRRMSRAGHEAGRDAAPHTLHHMHSSLPIFNSSRNLLETVHDEESKEDESEQEQTLLHRVLPFTWLRRPAVAKPSLALVAATSYCVVGGLIFVYVQGLRPVDAVYFMVVTMGTVGYGDFAPKTPGLKLFTVIWILVAIGFVFPHIAGVVGLFTGRWKELVNRVLSWMFPPKLVDIDGTGKADFALPESSALFYAKGLLAVNCLLLFTQLIMAAVFTHFEGWGYGDAVYHCFVTASTVGYGDIPIITDNGKIWCCVHILVSVAMLGDVLGTFEDVREEAAKREAKVKQGKKKMDPNLVKKLLAKRQAMLTTTSPNGGPGGGISSQAGPSPGISQSEFILSMLLVSGALSDDDIGASREMFANAGADETGCLSVSGLHNMVNSMQRNLAASVGAEAPPVAIVDPTPPPPPPPPPPRETASSEAQTVPPPPTASIEAQTLPPPTASSETQTPQPEPEPEEPRALVRIESQAVAQLSKLTTVRLSVVKTQTEMQFSIRFKEAKPLSTLLIPTASVVAKQAKPTDSGQIAEHRAGKLLSADAVVEDERLMRKICREIAQVFVVVSRLLVQEGLPPLGLSVDGHTSAETSVSQKLSFNQAKLVSVVIAEELAARDSSYRRTLSEIRTTGCVELPLGGRIDSHGYGSTRPLPEFDDGQIHDANGRVEVRLLGTVTSRPWMLVPQLPVAQLPQTHEQPGMETSAS